MEIKGKEYSLKIIFIAYLGLIAVAIALSGALVLIGMGGMFRSGKVLPSDAVERRILENKGKIETARPFDPALVPSGAKYLLLSKEGDVLQSDMDRASREKAEAFFRGKRLNTAEASYMTIERPEGVAVIGYSVKPHYADPLAERLLPSVDRLLPVSFLIACFAAVLGVTIYWAKKLAEQLNGMIEASRHIAKRDLDFTVEPSRVKEFNRVLEAMEVMKRDLEGSLDARWRAEEARKRRIAALAHDLKTPLAVVKGNGELLLETDLSEEQRSHLDYILSHTERLADYTEALMRANELEGESAVLEPISVRELALRCSRRVRAIAGAAERPFRERIEVGEGSACIDGEGFDRVVENIASNAVIYSEKGSEIALAIRADSALSIRIADRGRGFSPEALARGKEEFYRGDPSRSAQGHYGLGLYTSEKILRSMGGELILSNRKDGCGAEVIIRLPLV